MQRIGYDGFDWHLQRGQVARLFPVVIAHHSELKHKLEIIRKAAAIKLKQLAKDAVLSGDSVIEPGEFFISCDDTVIAAITDVLKISGIQLDWQSDCTPDDLVILLLGTESEPSLIDRLNYPSKANLTKQALDSGVPPELQALVTCMFLLDITGNFEDAKTMIETLTPEQLNVIVTVKTALLKQSGNDEKLTVKKLAALANVEEDTAEKVYHLLGNK